MDWYRFVWAGEAPTPPSSELAGLTDIPQIIIDLGWVGIAIVIAAMFVTGKWMSRKQHEELMDKEREVSAVWKQNAEELKPALQELIESLAPIGQGNAAILKAVEALQASNELDRRLRQYRGE